jgi:DNA-directed RNA polymerase specialized sigma24 family protein
VEVAECVESFESFYPRELPRLVMLARALAGDLAAEDVALESMLVAYRRWSQIATYPSAVAYVRGICAHQAVSAIRRTFAERRALRRYAAGRNTEQMVSWPDGDFWTEVRRLPRRQAQAAALYYALGPGVPGRLIIA